jgi:hypothetical protein
MFEQIQFVIDQTAIELANAIRVPEEVRASVRQIVTRTIGHVVRDFDLFHLIAIDGMRAKIARNSRHDGLFYLALARASPAIHERRASEKEDRLFKDGDSGVI